MTQLLDLPHAKAQALLASGAPVYLLVNPVEYHGPHPVYIFHDEAHAAMKKYADARQLLADLVERGEVPR